MFYPLVHLSCRPKLRRRFISARKPFIVRAPHSIFRGGFGGGDRDGHLLDQPTRGHGGARSVVAPSPSPSTTPSAPPPGRRRSHAHSRQRRELFRNLNCGTRGAVGGVAQGKGGEVR